jgi:hypothetical protein
MWELKFSGTFTSGFPKYRVLILPTVFSLMSRSALQSVKETGNDSELAKGMDPKNFLEVVGLREVIDLETQALIIPQQ